MSRPPEHIEPSALWLALQQMPRPSKVVDFPRKGIDGKPVGQLAIWILTAEEQMICTAAAEEFTKKHLKDGKKDQLGYESLYSNAVCVEILFRACRNVDDINRPAFPSPELLRRQFSTEELGVLFQHYLTVQLELGPIVTKMSDEEMKAWIARLKEGGSAFPLDSISWELQRILVLFMASLVPSSLTDNSSAGEQPPPPQQNEPSEAADEA